MPGHLADGPTLCGAAGAARRNHVPAGLQGGG